MIDLPKILEQAREGLELEKKATQAKEAYNNSAKSEDDWKQCIDSINDATSHAHSTYPALAEAVPLLYRALVLSIEDNKHCPSECPYQPACVLKCRGCWDEKECFETQLNHWLAKAQAEIAKEEGEEEPK